MRLAEAIPWRSEVAASPENREDAGSRFICIRPSVSLWAGEEPCHLTREVSLWLGSGACDLSPLTCDL